MERVILLDASYLPIDVISWKKAIKMLLKNKVEAIGEAFITINTSARQILVPKIVRLIKIVRHFFKQGVPFRKKNIFIRDHYKCAYCGKHVHNPTVDHIVPKSKGGKSTFENLVTCCFDCNNEKGNRLPSEAGLKLLTKPYHPTIHEHMKNVMIVNGVAELLDEVFNSGV